MTTKQQEYLSEDVLTEFNDGQLRRLGKFIIETVKNCRRSSSGGASKSSLPIRALASLRNREEVYRRAWGTVQTGRTCRCLPCSRQSSTTALCQSLLYWAQQFLKLQSFSRAWLFPSVYPNFSKFMCFLHQFCKWITLICGRSSWNRRNPELWREMMQNTKEIVEKMHSLFAFSVLSNIILTNIARFLRKF